MDDNSIYLKAKLDTSEIDSVNHKVEHLVQLLKEASSLLDELAAKREIRLPVEIKWLNEFPFCSLGKDFFQQAP